MGSPITEYKPSECLLPFVEVFWEGNFTANATHPLFLQVIPKGSVELIIHLNDVHCELYNSYGWSQSPDFMIIGLFSNPYEVHFNYPVKVFSIRFKPEGIFNIFGIPASLFKEKYEDMSLVIGTQFRDFSERLREEKNIAAMILRAESYLTQNLTQNKIELNYINVAAELIRKTKVTRIDELSRRIFISRRQLEREFKEKLGMSPKHYLRIIRLNEAQRLLNENRSINLTSVAYHCGYADQAHLIRDFKSFTGETPTVFIRGKNQYISNGTLQAYDH